MAGLKVLGRGELKHGLTIEADRVSESARQKIEKAGGTVTLRQRPSINQRQTIRERRDEAGNPDSNGAESESQGKETCGEEKENCQISRASKETLADGFGFLKHG